MRIKIYIASILLGGSLVTTSCDEAMKSNLPSEYATVMHFKRNKGEKEIYLPLLRVGEENKYNILIGKGGGNPSLASEAALYVMTTEELNEYCKDNSRDYQLLPAAYYTLSNNTVLFASNESAKSVEVTFKTEQIALNLDKEIQYVLPLRLAANKGAVCDELSVEILKIEVKTPVVTSDMIDIQHIVLDYYAETKTYDISAALFLNLNENNWNFEIKAETDPAVLQGYVDEYKNKDTTMKDYAILPATNYTVPASISFTPGDLIKDFAIHIDYNGLETGHYLMPIALKECVGKSFDVDKSPNFIHIEVKKQLPAITITDEMMRNSTRPEMGPNFGEKPRLINYLFDNDPATFWQSEWTVYTTPGMTQKPHDPKYGLYLDIELENSISLFAFDYQTREKGYLTNPKKLKLYFCNSKEELNETLQPAFEISSGLPTISSEWYRSEIYNLGEAYKYIRISCVTNQENKDLCDKTNSSITYGELRIYGK